MVYEQAEQENRVTRLIIAGVGLSHGRYPPTARMGALWTWRAGQTGQKDHFQAGGSMYCSSGKLNAPATGPVHPSLLSLQERMALYDKHTQPAGAAD